MSNPLSKYYRQPKIYLSLPSKGEYYPPGCINGDPGRLPVYGMTAMDEIMFKTPDGLFTGESMVSVIKSCVPAILDPWKIPSLDIDTVLLAIRIATYGQKMPASFTCKHCGESNSFDLDLSKTLDYFTGLTYENKIFSGPLVINLRPLTYKEQTEVSLKMYQIQRKLSQIQNFNDDDENKFKEIKQCMLTIAETQVEGFKRCIQSIDVDDETVDNQNEINEWIKHSDKQFFEDVKSHIERESTKWRIQKQRCQCGECKKENEVSIGLDNANFFASR